MAINSENSNAYRTVGTFLFHKGDLDRVIELGENVISKEGQPLFAWYSLLSSAYQRTNQPEKSVETLRKLEELSQTDIKALYSLAMNYSELGRSDDAIWALERCIDLREERLAWVNVEPRFADLKSDTRFIEIVKKMRLVY